MHTDTTIELPNIFPQGKIKVEDESHLYETFEGGDFEPVLEQFEYTLDKAPVDEIVSVTGVVDSNSVTFTEGTDYELSADSERIVWQDTSSAERPDPGSLFYVTYRCDSIISRYLASSEEELDVVNEEIDDVVAAKFVDSAEGRELDELGEIFGALGQRNGRTDTQYRIYLKSVVQSFISRGTVNGIKLAVSAATDVPIGDIQINEDFDTNEYEIRVVPNNPVTGSVIEEIAEIADPSGVSQIRTRFAPQPDETTINDTVSFSLGEKLAEQLSVTDTTGVTRRDRFETLRSQDSNAINQNKFTNTDQSNVTDGNAINQNKFTSADESSANDTGTVANTENVHWNDANWGELYWATEHN